MVALQKPSNLKKVKFKVTKGDVQYKNNWKRSTNYLNHQFPRPAFERQRPGQDYRHLLKKDDILQFLEILPYWSEFSFELKAILLAPGEEDCMGWHQPGVIAICAWPKKIIETWDDDFVEDHYEILERLGVELEPIQHGKVICHFTEKSAKGFQLMHVFLHELGHHFDRITTRSRKDSARGEDFAENISLQLADRLWDDYFRIFSW